MLQVQLSLQRADVRAFQYIEFLLHELLKLQRLVHSNTSSSSYMSFSSFNGTKTFKMNCNSASGGLLEYSAKLETGSATVYYDHDGNKTELFTIRGGEEIASTAVPVSQGPVYVIVETNEKCKEGKFDFNLKQ